MQALFPSILSLFLLFVAVLGNDTSDEAWFVRKKVANETDTFTQSRVHVLRLGPGEDLVDSLWRYARVLKIKAASIVSVVGSLTDTNIRYANQEDGTVLHGHFEIVSLVGNVDYQDTSAPNYEGSGHIHLACSDEYGVTVGGHALSGNIVYTTAEITLLEITNGLFDRVLDNGPKGSGYYELQVHRIMNETEAGKNN
jgi:predicted DNA-binding protein with PD1-like motif